MIDLKISPLFFLEPPSIKPTKEAEALYVAAVGLCEHYDCPLDWLRIEAPIWGSERWMRFDGQKWTGGYEPLTQLLFGIGDDPVAWLRFPSIDDAKEKIGTKPLKWIVDAPKLPSNTQKDPRYPVLPIAYMKGVKHKWTELWRVPEMPSFAAMHKVDVPGGSYLAPDRFVGCEKCKIDQLEITPRSNWVPKRVSPVCYYELTAILLPKAEPPLPLP